MKAFVILLPKAKFLIKEQTSRYLKGLYRKAEFILYVVLYIFTVLILIFGPQTYKGMVSTLQSFIAFFLVFRFGYLGLTIAFLFCVREFSVLFRLYTDTSAIGIAIGIVTKIFTVLSVVLVAYLTDKKEAQQERLHNLAVTDELTGVYNQRFFYQTLSKEIKEAQSNGGTVGLIMIDLDGFKNINDILGHEYGNQVLEGFGKLLRKLSEKRITPFRYGGDEFAVILPNVNLDTLKSTANHIKEEFQAYNRVSSQFQSISKVTLSMGLSLFPELSATQRELISNADMALYQAKNLGKDNIRFYQNLIGEICQEINPNHQKLITTFKTLLGTIAVKDGYTLAHSERVSGYALLIGEALGLESDQITILQVAGILHDIGKIGMPEAILNKAGRLTKEEYKLIRLHPILSANILEPLKEMGDLLKIVRHHHERFDGKGYPDGLKGSELSLGARILCVADAYDAMLSTRPYSKSISIEEACKKLTLGVGTQFDPQIVEVLFSLIEKDEFRKEIAIHKAY